MSGLLTLCPFQEAGRAVERSGSGTRPVSSQGLGWGCTQWLCHPVLCSPVSFLYQKQNLEGESTSTLTREEGDGLPGLGFSLLRLFI